MRKFMSAILATILTASISLPVFATSHSYEDIDANEIIIMVNSDEEAEKIIDEINKQNAIAEEMWEKALREAEENPIEVSESMGKTRAYTSSKVTKRYSFINGIKETIAYVVTYDSAKLGNGTSTPIFGSVYNITSYIDGSSDASLNVNHSQYARIDQGRTVACNFSLTVQIVTSSSTKYNSTVTSYVEFYATGGGGVW